MPPMKSPPIEISWQAGEPPPEPEQDALRAVLAGFLAALGYPASGLSLLLADDAALLALNERHRGLSGTTDILSWSYRGGGGGAPELLGEIAVSLDRVRAQAKANGWDERTELLRLLAHGCAHLAGYDHETEQGEREMRAVEIAMLDEAGLSGLYPDG